MEDWLKNFLRRTNNKFVTIIITIIIVFFALAGLIAVLGDLGFSDEIVKYRKQIWLALIILSIIGVLIQEVVLSLPLIDQ